MFEYYIGKTERSHALQSVMVALHSLRVTLEGDDRLETCGRVAEYGETEQESGSKKTAVERFVARA
jgi:hypothetical protein